MSASQRLILALAPPMDPVFDLSAVSARAAAAETGGVDFLLFGHPFFGETSLDALSLAAALAPATSRIGLTAAIDPRTLAPFHLARALASLDLLSAGRAGWMALLNDPGNPVSCERYAEHLEVVCALFDSWEDQALVFDKSNSLFADPRRVHRIRHQGRHFTVDGPLNTPRPPQGRPVMLQSIDVADLHGADIRLSTDADPAASGALRLRAVTVDFRDHPHADEAHPNSREETTPGGVAVRMADDMRSGGADGFVLLLAESAMTTARILNELIPRLASLGFHVGGEQAPAEGGSADLRTRLGLARPLNRFSPEAKAPA